MKKIAIIGASYLQIPLIKKAKEMGLETHVFAWKCGDPGETEADYFYPISITEKEEILKCCKEISIDAICSIASDLAVHVVNYVAHNMGLTGNSRHSTEVSTNKYKMRQAFISNGVPSPRFLETSPETIKEEVINIPLPVIVKPEDRSGSRGVTKVLKQSDIEDAVIKAAGYGFEKKALIEEYILGKEYSVECISYKGKHHLLAVTEKYTTGEPHFIETGHMEPAVLDKKLLDQIQTTVFHALDTLEIEYGASHSEIKIDNGKITIVEIGARMGGDFIGSDLVKISTGVDYVKAVIDVAMGIEPEIPVIKGKNYVAIHFITQPKDIECYNRLKIEHPEYIVSSEISENPEFNVVDSSSRHGYFLMQASSKEELDIYMPENK